MQVTTPMLCTSFTRESPIKKSNFDHDNVIITPLIYVPCDPHRTAAL